MRIEKNGDVIEIIDKVQCGRCKHREKLSHCEMFNKSLEDEKLEEDDNFIYLASIRCQQCLDYFGEEGQK